MTTIVPLITDSGGGPSGPLPWWGFLIVSGISFLLGVMFLAMTLDITEMSCGGLSDRLMNGCLWVITGVGLICGVVFLFIPLWRFIT